jgi:ABC-type antimicrobial peptide transport system permease subunit
VVGVVKTVKDFHNLEKEESTIYLPVLPKDWFLQMVLVVRSDGNPMRLVEAIQAQATGLEKGRITWGIETIEERLSGMLRPRKFNMILLSLFAAVALILAMVGVYGLLHYSTTQQTRDIAIRMALGARKTDVLGTILKQGIKLSLIGVAVGLAGALAVTRVLSSLLFDVTATDLPTLVVVSIVLSIIALMASYIPARRAAKIDPMEALRYE